MTIQNTRRNFLKKSALVTTIASSGFILPKVALAMPHAENSVYELSFRHLHTGETFSGVYRVGDEYLVDALEQINYVLRDFRTGEVHPMDPKLLDLVYAVQKISGGMGKKIEVISGYRSPKTNAMLRVKSSGVAKKSYHMTGQAIDIRIPGVPTTRIRDVAKQLKVGGVGYYASSNFVHLDTGDVRSW